MEKRYRIVPPPRSIPSSNTLEDRIYAEIAADKPDHPSCYEGEWVCDHWPCPMRVVRLRVKAMYHRHLPRLRCPLCLRALVFRHWLHVVALQEIPVEAAKALSLLASKALPRRRSRKSKRSG
jgi:hypothetical protein